MNAVQDVSASPALLATPGTAKATGSANETQDRFLKLLVTQMKNQDPLNPMDNAQVTSQMAQLSTVSGIDKLNATLESLAAGQMANQSLQAAALIGHHVLVPGSSLTLEGGNAWFGVDLPQSADQVVVTVRDMSGKALHTLDLGPQAAGTVALHWDGVTDSGAAAASGAYSFSVDALQGDRKIEANALSLVRVDGVTQGKDGAMLSLGGGTMAALSDVKQIL